MNCSVPAPDEHAPPLSSRPAGLREALLALAPGRALSVAQLAHASGLPLAMVATSVDALRAAGLPVQSPRAGWYRLPWALQMLDAGQIRAALPAAAAARLGALEVCCELDSTSTELQRRGAAAPDLGFLLAESQSAGRGRRGRGWLSPPGLNLQISCLKRFAGGVGGLAGLSLVVGLSVLRGLEALGVTGVGLKWPNDLQARSGPDAGGKLAGILVELAGGRQGPATAIVGVGLNLRLTAAMRERVAQPLADLAGLCGGQPPDRNLVAAGLVAALIDGLREFEDAGFAAFRADYARHDLLLGQALRLTGGGLGPFAGVGAGIDARGALQVRLADGTTRTLDSAEISVRRP
jgi:BirA family biotin operon repressor/biotin-[acetyl-CoA-carboxylase] ligase